MFNVVHCLTDLEDVELTADLTVYGPLHYPYMQKMTPLPSL